MKKITSSLLAILIAFAAFFTACNDKPDPNNGKPSAIPVTAVTLNQSTATVGIGGTLQLTATVLPDSASNKTITWSSSHPAVASVVNGTVVGLTAGTTTITAISQCGNRAATCVVTVLIPVSVAYIELCRTSATMGGNDTLRLTAIVLPEHATNKTVIWSSSNPAVATVNNGLVTSFGVAGTTNIVAITQDGNRTATCNITVILASGVTLNQTTARVVIDSTLQLTATVLPANAPNRVVTWSSSDTTVAIVTNGVVRGIALGSATITATTQDGNHTATCAVQVTMFDCNQNTPSWGASLGTVTRGTQEWRIQGAGVTQIWSDAVTATVCNKTAFSGGSDGNFNADCRSNPNYPGDLFSWCAVVRFRDQLCPAPWRVPTQQDFIDLDRALGGSGENRTSTSQFVASNYVTRWGSAFGGYCRSDGTLISQGSSAHYWSQTEIVATNGGYLAFSANGIVYPRLSDNKSVGYTLRCVR